MQPQTVGLIIGGFVPAVFYAFSGIFAKYANTIGIGLAPYLMITGVTIAVTGVAFGLFQGNWSVSGASALHAFGLGATWGIGTGLVAIALSSYGAPLGKLVPLYNMNTLIAVLLALWLFAEWQSVKVPQLLLGSLLIVVGGTLVAKA